MRAPSLRLALVVPLLAALVLVAPPRQASATDGRAALLRERGEAFALAFADGGDSLLSAFARDHLQTAVDRGGRTPGFVARMKESRVELGAIERHAVRIPSAGAVVFVYVKTTKGGWVNYQFRTHPEDGDRLELVFRAVAMEPMEPPAVAADSDSARAWLDRFVGVLDGEHPFGGVCVLQHRGRDVWSRVQGVADATSKAPLSRASRFGMASGSKLFTAVAILQLVEAGSVSLDDPLIRHLPDFPNPEFARRTTIRALLGHTAGAGNYWDDAYESAWDGITETKQMLPHVLRHLDETPAGTYSYSNSGFILLGLVIEAVSKWSYFDYVEERILKPAGMEDTGFPLRADADARATRAYEAAYDAGVIQPGVYVPVRLGARGSAAGGAVTTADDMFRFAAALSGGKLLAGGEKALLGDALSGAAAKAGRESHGLGAIVQAEGGVVSLGHGGIARGTYFEFRMYPGLDAVLVVLSNYNTIGPVELASAVDALVRHGFEADGR